MPAPLLGTQTRDALSRLAVRALTPNEILQSAWEPWFIVTFWYALWIALWEMFRPVIFPSPWDVFNAFPALWMQDGLGDALLSSLTVASEALVLSAAISLPLAYLCRVPAIRPLARAVAQLRFLSPAVFFLMLLLLASNGHIVKVLMLTMGETFFLVTSMIDIVDAIPNERFDDCRTLRMSEWQATWYTVVRGTLSQAIQAIRANNAMGFASLMMVEGIVRSEGGVGVMILNNEKHMEFASLWAIATAILLVGLGMDFLISLSQLVICPYMAAGRER